MGPVRGDPDKHTAQMTEEVLRWATPVMYFRRNATRDFELRGETIEDGDKIALYYISANRDEEVFDDPFRFDIERDPNPHIAFGGGGPHFCLGAQLARMEIHVLFEEMAQRVKRTEGLGDTRPTSLELHRRHQARHHEVGAGRAKYDQGDQRPRHSRNRADESSSHRDHGNWDAEGETRRQQQPRGARSRRRRLRHRWCSALPRRERPLRRTSCDRPPRGNG